MKPKEQMTEGVSSGSMNLVESDVSS